MPNSKLSTLASAFLAISSCRANSAPVMNSGFVWSVIVNSVLTSHLGVLLRLLIRDLGIDLAERILQHQDQLGALTWCQVATESSSTQLLDVFGDPVNMPLGARPRLGHPRLRVLNLGPHSGDLLWCQAHGIPPNRNDSAAKMATQIMTSSPASPRQSPGPTGSIWPRLMAPTSLAFPSPRRTYLPYPAPIR